MTWWEDEEREVYRTFGKHLEEHKVHLIRYLDHGFYHISQDTARALTGGPLPKPGWEHKVEVGGIQCWIARTDHRDRVIWSIRRA